MRKIIATFALGWVAALTCQAATTYRDFIYIAGNFAGQTDTENGVIGLGSAGTIASASGYVFSNTFILGAFGDLGGDNSVQRYQAPTGGSTFTFTLAGNLPTQNIYLVFRDVDLSDTWTISTPGVNPTYLGTADDNTNVNFATSGTGIPTYTPGTFGGTLTGSGVAADNFASFINITGATSVTITTTGTGSQWGLIADLQAVPEASTIAYAAFGMIGLVALMSRKSRFAKR